MSKAKGFTLIELIMVILIASIISAFAMAKAGFFNGWKEAGAGQSISSYLMASQRLALSNKSSVFVVITSQSIKSCYDLACALPCVNLDGSAMNLVMPSGSVASTSSGFSFDAEGRPSFTGAFNISYLGYSVNIEPETGLIW